MAATILLIEDNEDLRISVAEYLQQDGFTIQQYSSAESAEQELEDFEFALAVVDINLPGKSGFDFVRDLREAGYTFPLIALTARDQIEDKVRGFELGLSDYVVKPFSLAELAARIRANIRDIQARQLATKHLHLSPDRREVQYGGSAINLTGTEFRLLEALVMHNRTIVTTDDLVEHAWGAADLGSDPPVRIHMRNLRKKLGDTDMKLIKTISGLGYMLDD